MTKNHLKRIMVPKTWPSKRKASTFVIRPNPGGHKLEASVTLNMLMIDMLGIAHTARGVRFILNTEEVRVNGKRRRRPDDIVGLFDVVTFPTAKSSYRILFSKLNKIVAIPIAGEEANLVPSKVTSKRRLDAKRYQLGFHNGKTLITDSTHTVGDTLLLSLDGKIKDKYGLKTGAYAYFTAGKHVGMSGPIKGIKDGMVTISTPKGDLETRKPNVFVLGEKSPTIKIEGK